MHEETQSLDSVTMMMQTQSLIRILPAQAKARFLKSPIVEETNIILIRQIRTKILVKLISSFLGSRRPREGGSSKSSITR